MPKLFPNGSSVIGRMCCVECELVRLDELLRGCCLGGGKVARE
jgi:hypothetical protein